MTNAELLEFYAPSYGFRPGCTGTVGHRFMECAAQLRAADERKMIGNELAGIAEGLGAQVHPTTMRRINELVFKWRQITEDT